jgi:hypothetical protein
MTITTHADPTVVDRESHSQIRSSSTVTGERSSSSEKPTVTYAVYSWQWKEEAPIEAIERGFDEMCALGEDIPGVRRATWGRNTADAAHARGHTHTMIVIADDEAAVMACNERTSKHPMADVIHAAEKSGVGTLFSRPV